MANAQKRRLANGYGVMGIEGSKLQEQMRQCGVLRHSADADDLQRAMKQGGTGRKFTPRSLQEAMKQG